MAAVRTGKARATALAASIAAMVTAWLVPLAPAQAAEELTWVDQPAISPLVPRVGVPVVGTVGTWSRDGLTWDLAWERCDVHAENCQPVHDLTTSDPQATLSYTPTSEDLMSGATLRYVVTASDDVESATFWVFSAITAAERWQPLRRSALRGESLLAPDGTTTVFSSDTVGGRDRLVSQTISPTGERGGRQVVFEAAEGDTPGYLHLAVDDAGGLYVTLTHDIDENGPVSLQVVERPAGASQWSEPHLLETSGGLYDPSFHASKIVGVVADGQGKAAVAWVSPRTEDDPQELHVARRTGPGAWEEHTVDQDPVTDCTEVGDMPVGAVDSPMLDIDDAGNVTAVWSRGNERCPWPHPEYWEDQLLESATFSAGSWSEARTVATNPGFLGYVPRSLRVGDAGAELLLGTPDGQLRRVTTGQGEPFPAEGPEDPPPGEAVLDGQGDPVADPVVLSHDLADSGATVAGWNEGDQTVLLLGGPGQSPTVSRLPRTGPTVRVAVAEDGTAAVALARVTRGGLAFAPRSLAYAVRSPEDDAWPGLQTVHASGSFYEEDALLQQVGLVEGTPVLVGQDDPALDDRRTFVTRLAVGEGAPVVTLPSPFVSTTRAVELQPIEAEDPDGGELVLEWDLDGDGAFDDGTGPTVTHLFSEAGWHDVSVRATASDGDRTVAETRVRAQVNEAPTVHSIGSDPLHPVAGQEATLWVTAFDDLTQDGDLLYRWAIGDDEPFETTDVVVPHTFATAGSHDVTVVAIDEEDLESEPVTVTVSVEEDPSAPTEHELSIDLQGSGSATVTSDPAGIDCGDTCSAEFEEGTTVTVEVDVADDSRLLSMSGCDAYEETSCTVEMDSDVSVMVLTAAMSDTHDPVTVTRAGKGSGTVSSSPEGIDCGTTCTGWFARGGPMTLQAHPAAGSKVAGWSGCTSVSGATCTLDLLGPAGAHDVTVTFVPAPPNTKITGTKVKGRKATFTFTGKAGVAPYTFQCRVDKAAWKACKSGVTYKRPPGKHRFEVRATDAASRTDASPASTTFKVKKKK